MVEQINGNLICYNSRNDVKYLNKLKEMLDLKHLKNTAQDNPKKNDEKYQKVIRIDFCGIAATTLLLKKDNCPEQNEVRERFHTILKNLTVLEQDKYKIRIRFLFVYPYSDFAFSLIEAEKSPFRPTMSEKHADESALNLFSLTGPDFTGSDLFITQRSALHEIERLYNKYCGEVFNIDLLNLRFTCLPINMCMISINNEYFIDTYSYGKFDRFSKVRSQTPLIEITENFPENIEELEDHFRYIWTHPTTLLYEDATNYKFYRNGQLENLNSIKEPHNVTFDNKVNRFKELLHQKELARQLIDDERIDKWKFRVERMFRNKTRVVEVSPESETVFIAFSFANGKTMAELLRNFLNNDFPEGTLKVNIVDINTAKKNFTLRVG